MTAMIKLSKKGECLGRVDVSDSALMPAPVNDASIGETPKKRERKYHSMFG